MRLRIVALLVFVGAYVASIVLYANSGMGYPYQITESQPSGDGTTVTIDIYDIELNNSVLRCNLTVSPGSALLDPLTHKLKEDLSVAVTSALTPSKRTWSKGTLPEVSPVSLTVAGDLADWPIDRYRTGPITVELISGATQVPQRATVIFVDRLLGWKADVPGANNADVPGPYRVQLHRSPSTAAFAVVVLGVLIVLAGLALFVAVQTLRDRRKFQPPMTTWYAAMLFAVMPLRSALPDSPPFGSWIDITVVLWVIAILAISMALYIACWWRHLRPDAATPVDPVPAPSTN
jgi:Domain of unknown function (DUF4436)